MAINYNELSAVVVQHIDDPKNWDALAKRTALMNWFMTKGKEKIDGGLTYNWPVKLIANASQGFGSGTSMTVDTNPSIQLQYGTLPHSYFNFAVNFTLQDYAIANGKSEVVKFMTKKTEGAYNDALRAWSTAAHMGTWGGVTGSSQLYPLNPVGLLDVVAASGTAYAGLTNTSFTDTALWLSNIDSSTATPNYQNINILLNKIKAKTQKEMPTDFYFGITNENVYSKYQTSIQNQQIFTKASIFESGSEGFNVNGMDVVMDPDCPGTKDGSTADNYFYILPSEVLKMYYRFGFGAKSPFDGDIRLPNQAIKSIQQFLVFNFACTRRNLVGVFKAFVA